MDVPSSETNASFDPWAQDFTILLQDCVAAFDASTADIYLVQQSAINQDDARCSRHTERGSHPPLIALLLIIKKTSSILRCSSLRGQLGRECTIRKLGHQLKGGRAGRVTIRHS
jgi:hypothetical protein